MKITCVSCSAKYSLADEKVAGRSFKIRCKKCGEPIVVRASEPAPAMTGTRNESSALFSLSQLSEISRPKPAEKPAEGSGLIDMRALATAVKTAPSPVEKPKEDLFSSFAASPIAAAPVLLMPTEKKSSTPALAIASLAIAAVAVAAAVVVVVTFGGDNDAMADARPNTPPPVQVREPVRVEPAHVDPVTVTQPEQPEVTQPIAAPQNRHRPEPIARPDEPRPPVVQEDESLEQMVEILAPERHRPQQVEERLPATPSRNDVGSALSGVASAVRQCGQGSRGMATTRIVFSGESGRVSEAVVTNTSLTPEVRSCVARAARSAHVPRFAQRTFSVNYPFAL